MQNSKNFNNSKHIKSNRGKLQRVIIKLLWIILHSLLVWYWEISIMDTASREFFIQRPRVMIWWSLDKSPWYVSRRLSTKLSYPMLRILNKSSLIRLLVLCFFNNLTKVQRTTLIKQFKISTNKDHHPLQGPTSNSQIQSLPKLTWCIPSRPRTRFFIPLLHLHLTKLRKAIQTNLSALESLGSNSFNKATWTRISLFKLTLKALSTSIL